jgi:hypothetical protein
MQIDKNEIRNTKKTKQKQHTLTVITKQRNKITIVTKQPYPGNIYKFSEECHKLRSEESVLRKLEVS